MLRSATMRYAEIMVLNRDLAAVTRLLSELQCVQLVRYKKTDTGWNSALLKQLEESEASLEGLTSWLELPSGQPGEEIPKTGAEEALEAARTLSSRLREKAAPLKEEEAETDQRLQTLQKSRAEFSAFEKLDFDFGRINSVSYLFFKYGTVPASRLAELEEQAGNKSLIIRLDTNIKNNRLPVLAASSKKGRFALETALNGCAFQETIVPDNLKGIPAEIAAGMDQEIAVAGRKLEQTRKQIAEIADDNREALFAVQTAILANIGLLKTMQTFEHTEYTATIRCWMPASGTGKLRKALDNLTKGKAALEEKNPRELPDDFLRENPVPVLLRNNGLFKPFEFLISNYGYPKYGEIEPTPVVAFGFVAMFGIMFGDVGQGGILFLTGILLSLMRGLKKSIRQAGILISTAGLSAAFFGWVFGSVFCNPHLLHPLWTEPLANPDDILTLFGATIAFGVFWINTGIFLNLVNRIRARDWKGTFLDKTGLVGLVFYLGTLSLAVGAGFFKMKISGTPVLLLSGLPLAILFLREPIYALFCRKPLFEHGFFTFFVEGLVELIDTVSYFLGNTVSFVRVGAFALAHGGLSLAFMELYKMVGGGIAGIAVLVLGNLLIIVLEGMVVTIQTMRLEYYEFFSKFYSGSGIPFNPFSLTGKSGG